MEEMEKYLSTIKNETHRKHLRQIFDWIMQNFPELEYKTMWNQLYFWNTIRLSSDLAPRRSIFLFLQRQKE